MTFNPSKLKYEFKDFIGIYENAFTEEECDDTIKLFNKYDKFKYTYKRGDNFVNDTSADVVELDWSPGFIYSFHSRFYDYLYPLYNNQYASLQSLIKHKSKQIKIQKTLPSQGYHVWHCEVHGADENQRVLSWILYLNDVEDGGETEFLYQSLRIKPKMGTFILFPAYFTHTHRGNPPLSGVKYVATGWIEFLNTPEYQGKSEVPNLNENVESKNYLNYN